MSKDVSEAEFYKMAYIGLQNTIDKKFISINEHLQELKFENNKLHIKIDILEQKIDQLNKWPDIVPTNLCSVCGLDLSKATNYVCTRVDCPSGVAYCCNNEGT